MVTSLNALVLGKAQSEKKKDLHRMDEGFASWPAIMHQVICVFVRYRTTQQELIKMEAGSPEAWC